jgi:hypothetical protein
VIGLIALEGQNVVNGPTTVGQCSSCQGRPWYVGTEHPTGSIRVEDDLRDNTGWLCRILSGPTCLTLYPSNSLCWLHGHNGTQNTYASGFIVCKRCYGAWGEFAASGNGAPAFLFCEWWYGGLNTNPVVRTCRNCNRFGQRAHTL